MIGMYPKKRITIENGDNMCRFNLIMVKDKKTEELLRREGYHKFYDNLLGTTAYQKGYCNCGSFVGSQLDKKGMDYNEAIEERKREEIIRLTKIRELMNQPGYKEDKEKFLQIRMKFTDELQELSKSIIENEMKRTEEIREKYSGKEQQEQMNKLYMEINDMFTALRNQPEFLKKSDAYTHFLEENKLMEESTRYFLTREEQSSLFTPGIPLSQLINTEDNPQPDEKEVQEVLELEEENSFVIDEALEKAEKENDAKNQKEYQEYHRIFSEILKYEESVIFATIWVEPKSLKSVETVGIEALKIDDLAFLDYDEMICITR
jgi:hypothetical protein